MVASGGGGGGLIKAVLVVAIKPVDGGRWFHSRAAPCVVLLSPGRWPAWNVEEDETCREIYTRVPAILDIWQW